MQVLQSNIVAYVEEDRAIFGGTIRNTTSWGLNRIDGSNDNLDYCFNLPCSLTGKGVDVYVLDTGSIMTTKSFQEKLDMQVNHKGFVYTYICNRH